MLALLIGLSAGLRTLTPPAAVSWAARVGWLDLRDTPLAFLGAAATPWILTAVAVGELITDKLPRTPSRKRASAFIARIVSGALCGAAVGAARQALAFGLLAGAVGAVVGTLGGYEFRRRLAQAIGWDLPAALLEDVLAIGLSIWAVRAS